MGEQEHEQKEEPAIIAENLDDDLEPAVVDQLKPFSCTFTPEVPQILHELNCTIIISSYSAGKIILISSTDGKDLVQLPRSFDRAMGFAVEGHKLAIATRKEMVLLANDAGLAEHYPNQPNTYDALFVPRAVNYCGRLNLHDINWGHDGTIIGVNTSFSCLSKFDTEFGFEPFWKPPFISQLASEDRCHLNGMALEDKEIRYATAFSTDDTPEGWRDKLYTSGILMEYPSGEIILDGLAMPHTPRIFDGELYLLLSASGYLVKVNPKKKNYEILSDLNGFGRAMDVCGDYLFIGLSRIRKK